MPRVLLLLALTTVACFSDAPPQRTATGSTSDATTAATTQAPTTGATTTGAAELSSTSSTASTSTTTTTSTGTTDTDTGGPAVDPCEAAAPVCPEGPSLSPGAGLEPIDRCNFPLVEGLEWETHGALLDQLAAVLPTRSIGQLLGDLNRAAAPAMAVPGDVAPLELTFRWDDDDFAKAWWIPQGLTGTADAYDGGLLDGREALLVSWYFDAARLPDAPEDKGVRVTLVDVTEPDAVAYRHILLVEPVAGEPVDFKPVPIHAGGVVWYGGLLFVADTSAGLRVFDLERILDIDSAVDAIGYDPQAAQYHAGLYSYAAVQIGAYRRGAACAPRFSTLALDRSASPPQLVVAEYCNGTDACDGAHHGRIFAWPIDLATGRLPAATTWASAAAYTGQSHLQGATRSAGTVFLSSSAPPSDGGALYVLAAGGPSVEHGWIDTPEALMLAGDRIWSLSEKSGARFVFAAPRDGYE